MIKDEEYWRVKYKTCRAAFIARSSDYRREMKIAQKDKQRMESLRQQLAEAQERAEAFISLEKEFRGCKRYKSGDGLCCQCSDFYFELLQRQRTNDSEPQRDNDRKQAAEGK